MSVVHALGESLCSGTVVTEAEINTMCLSCIDDCHLQHFSIHQKSNIIQPMLFIQSDLQEELDLSDLSVTGLTLQTTCYLNCLSLSAGLVIEVLAPLLLPLHALRHVVSEGVLEAAGDCPRVLAGECAHWAGAGCQQGRELEIARGYKKVSKTVCIFFPPSLSLAM